MNVKNRLVSFLLALCLMTSTIGLFVVPATAADNDNPVETYAQSTVDGSVILHCFDWSYKSIKAALPDIAAAGYTAVQTSPVQRPKDYNASWTDVGGQWWKLYQPLGLSVADGNTWLGTKADLTALCTEAEKYNIKVIVDIVANHLANNGNSGGTYSNLNGGVDSDLKNSSYFHSDANGVDDNSRYNITQRHLGMPDLNTGNSYIQQKVLGLLKECVDCGVDGFRFDAAKHIEVPNDPAGTKSDFWPAVINGINNYKSGLYIYGEILGSAGTDIGNYTQYMSVTDNYTGDRALDKAYYQAADELADSSYYKGAGASKSVLWAESHDTYMGSSGMAGLSNTASISDDVIVRAWAIIAARSESSSLFFARPNSVMGAASSDTTWKSKAVAEINKFKNAFDGKSEYLSSSGKSAYVERGTKGVVISKLDGGGNVSLPAHTMIDGTYKDQITGNTFTVSGKTITGTVGSTGVAVVYNTDDLADPVITAEKLYLIPNSIWNRLNLRYAMYLFNSNGDSRWVSMTQGDGNVYSADVPTGGWNNVIFCGLKPSSSENSWENKVYQTDDLFPDSGTDCYTVAYGSTSNGDGTWSKYDGTAPTEAPTTAPTVAPTVAPTASPATAAPTTPPSGDTKTVYVINQKDWNAMYVYYWGTSADPSWPGTAMTEYSGKKVYTAQIPNGAEKILFNNGSGTQTVNIESGVTDGACWIISSEKDGNYYKVNTPPTYYLVGTMNDWKRNNNAPTFKLSASDSGKVEYKLTTALEKDAEFKANDSNGTWYPRGNNCQVTEAGTYDIYFRPNGDGNDDWHEETFYVKNVTPHTVTWKDGDGNTLKTETVTHGDTPVYSGATPTKTADDQHSYTFNNTWSPAVGAVTADTTYTAQFDPTAKTYTITWLNGDGEVLKEEQLAYGVTPNYTGDTPTKAPVNQYSFVFSGEWSPAITPVTDDAVYMAQFSTTAAKYTVTWKNGDTVLETDTDLTIGTMPSYDGATPTKAADARYTYQFMGWSPEVVPVRGDVTYTALFANVTNKYIITWKDYDGTVLEIDDKEYGLIPTYDSAEPSRENTERFTYTFAGWDPEVSEVTGDTVYTAKYDTTEWYTVSVTNVADWNNVYLYYWTDDGDNTWPGEKMTADADNFIYTAKIPSTAKGIVFNSGSNANQTVNIDSDIENGAHWAILNEKDDSNYKVNAVPTYYLVGTMTGWDTVNAPVFTPFKNSDKIEEYKLSGVELKKDAMIKVSDGNTWYPDGTDNHYTVTSDGTYDVYFRPNADGDNTWHEKYFKLRNVTTYTVTWIDGDGNTLKTDTVTYGDTPAYDGATPTKTGDAQYSYTFNGNWDPSIAPASGNVTYTAQFDRTVNEYTVTFLNEDGTELQSEKVAYGEIPVYKGDTPTKEEDIHNTYTFSGWSQEIEAVTGEATYTATYLAQQKAIFAAHSLSLNGDISVNFYLNLTEEQAQDATVSFTWFTKELKDVPVALDPAGSGYYKVTCPIAVAEMTYEITATLTIGDTVQDETNQYSAVSYADVILTDSTFIQKYIAKFSAEKYAQLAQLVKSMLDYGAKAQVQFDRDTKNLANSKLTSQDSTSPYYYAPAEVTPKMISDAKKDMATGLDAYGLSYAGPTIVYLTKTSLRLYYKVENQAAFESADITLNGEKVDYTEKNGKIYFEKQNIAAPDLDEEVTLKIGDLTFKYSVMDYVHDCLISEKISDNMKALVAATYHYNNAANVFFGS